MQPGSELGWLENFAYKSTMSWWIFAVAGGVTLCDAFATISIQSVKAAMMNPIITLRGE